MSTLLGLLSVAAMIGGGSILFMSVSAMQESSGFILILTSAVLMVGAALYDRIGDLIGEIRKP